MVAATARSCIAAAHRSPYAAAASTLRVVCVPASTLHTLHALLCHVIKFIHHFCIRRRKKNIVLCIWLTRLHKWAMTHRNPLRWSMDCGALGTEQNTHEPNETNKRIINNLCSENTHNISSSSFSPSQLVFYSRFPSGNAVDAKGNLELWIDASAQIPLHWISNRSVWHAWMMDKSSGVRDLPHCRTCKKVTFCHCARQEECTKHWNGLQFALAKTNAIRTTQTIDVNWSRFRVWQAKFPSAVAERKVFIEMYEIKKCKH